MFCFCSDLADVIQCPAPVTSGDQGGEVRCSVNMRRGGLGGYLISLSRMKRWRGREAMFTRRSPWSWSQPPPPSHPPLPATLQSCPRQAAPPSVESDPAEAGISSRAQHKPAKNQEGYWLVWKKTRSFLSLR